MVACLCALSAGIALLAYSAWAFTRSDTRTEMVDQPRFEHVISLGYVAHRTGAGTEADRAGSPVTADSGVQPPLFAPVLSKIDLAFQYEMRSAQQLTATGYGGVALRINAQDGWERTIALLPAQPLPEGAQQTLWSTLDVDVVRLVIDGVEFATGSRSEWYDLTLVPVVRLFGDLGGSHIDETYAPEFHWRYTLSQITPDPSLTRQDTQYVSVAVVRDVDAPGLGMQLATVRWLALALGVVTALLALPLLWLAWRGSRREDDDRTDPHAAKLREAASYVPEFAESVSPTVAEPAIRES